jgi:hypothetical protein
MLRLSFEGRQSSRLCEQLLYKALQNAVIMQYTFIMQYTKRTERWREDGPKRRHR